MKIPKHEQPDYLDLLENVIMYSFWPERNMDWNGNLGGVIPIDMKETGQAAWPSVALTMIGRPRLRNIRDLIGRVVADNIPGDFAECGVWRGGACIYARACLPPDRTVHVCDTFSGFPASEPEAHWKSYKCLEVSQVQVMENFTKLGLIDGVNFIAGSFEDTLPKFTSQLAVLRIDADSVKSTTEALTLLWPHLSVGGYLICDDYKSCGLSPVFQKFLGTLPPLNDIDQSSIWFQKTA